MCVACGGAPHLALASANAGAPSGQATAGGHEIQRFAALRHPRYRWFFVTNMLAMMADNIEHVITYWILWERFQSPALAGFAVLSHWVPYLLLSVHLGALADRYDSRKLLQFSMGLFAAVSVAWGYLIGTSSLEIWHAIVLLTLHGLAGAIWSPSQQMLLYGMVPNRDLGSAIRLGATGRQLGLLAGPAVGGGLLLLLGPTVGILVNAFFYAPLIIQCLFLPAPDVAGRPQGVRLSLGEAAKVLGVLRDNRAILALVALVGFGSLFVGSTPQVLMPAFAQRLGSDSGGLSYTLLLTANALGAVAGGLILETVRISRLTTKAAIFAMGVLGVSTAAFAVVHNYPVAIALLLIGGFAALASQTIAQTIVQLQAPENMRGQVIGVFNMASLGLRVGSGLTVGVLGSLIGVENSLALSACVLALASAGVWLYARSAPSATA
jgi:MFS family permease